ncbi:hypothetical protein B566_EDAN011144 [Ephemera danica]|nr:hypothetical protein B566_EDAN011144 [Ephemera danica]
MLHYVVTGPENTPYEGGMYHGKLVFSPEFPYKPPSIYMITPNGRFKTNMRLCLSISDYHPDTWNPAWSVSTILTGLLSFMTERSPTLGSIEMADSERQELALQSLDYNLHNKTFCQLFPETVQQIKQELKHREEAAKNGHAKGEQAEAESGPPGMGRRNMSSGTMVAGGQQEQSPLQAAITNILICVCVVVFALIVKYVVTLSNPAQ